jgi:lipoprotein signal peptidase
MNEEIQSTTPQQFLNQTNPFSWLRKIILLILATQVVRMLFEQMGWPIFLNDRFAFSLNVATPIMYVIYIVVLTLVCIFLYRKWQELTNLLRWAFALILAGGVSNVLERMWFGHVTDYIFILNGVLNLADVMIIVGAVLVLSRRHQH